jgi:phage tail-like protein
MSRDPLAPLHVFRFDVRFVERPLSGSGGGGVELCRGAFSDVSGLEANIDAFEVREGGLNYGSHRRMGKVTFATVVLKRGISPTKDLWTWFSGVAQGSYTHRLDVTVTLNDIDGTPVRAWQLDRALPVKFKVPDLSASNNEIGVEELHLAHEGLREISVGGGA